MEEDLLLMEDNRGDSPKTKEWFSRETERYVGFEGRNTLDSCKDKDPVLPSTNPAALKQEDVKRLVRFLTKEDLSPSLVWRMWCPQRCVGQQSSQTRGSPFILRPLLGGLV